MSVHHDRFTSFVTPAAGHCRLEGDRQTRRGVIATNLRLIALFALLTLTAASAALGQGLAMAGQLQVNGQMTIVFTASTVSCTGLSPGDSVALVGFMIDRQAGSQAIITPTISQAADANGAFTATIEGGVKPRSIWLLIDQTAGGYTVAEPEGSVLMQIPSEAISITSDLPDADVTIHRAHTHVIWIREGSRPIGELRSRGLGAMEVSPTGFAIYDAKDGSQADTDNTIDGTVHLSVPSFLDPSQISTCLFFIDDRTLEFYVDYLRFSHSPTCRPGDC